MKIETQEALKIQIEERGKTVKKVWDMYAAAMNRLIENPGARPDTSELILFIRCERDEFGRNLAKVFKDAIEFGHLHVCQISAISEAWGGGENDQTQQGI